MISEVDLRDWEGVDFQSVDEALSGGVAFDGKEVILEFVSQVENLFILQQEKCRNTNKRVAALLREIE